jgi:Flp pilus assembly protein CpaB
VDGDGALTVLVPLLAVACLPAPREADSVLVVAAARELHVGVPIAEDDLYGVRVPAGRLPPGVFLTPGAVVGRVPTARILADELVRGERLAGEGRLSGVVPPGMRAITVRVDDAVLQWLNPGNVVDVLWRHADRGETLAQERIVLGIAGAHVTLLVTPAQAEGLDRAERTGEVVLVPYHGGWFDPPDPLVERVHRQLRPVSGRARP